MNFLAGNEKRFLDFMSNLTEKDKIAIISHIDLDGLASAVIASKVIKADYINFLAYGKDVLKPVIDEFKKRGINKIIFLDFVVSSEDIKNLEKFAEILVIDHHAFDLDLNSGKTVFIKTETKFPATYSCYYLFSKLGKIPTWIAALGVLGDMIHYTEENYKDLFKDYSLGEPIEIWNEMKNTGLALIYFKDKKEEVYNIMMKAKNLDDLGVLKKYADKIREEIDEQMKNYEKNKEVHGDLVFFYFELKKHDITAALVNMLNKKNKDVTYVFVSKSKEEMRVSARRQDRKVDCIKLLAGSLKNIPDSGSGGHIPAAGGFFPAKYLGKFKENLIKEYSLITK